MIDLKASSEHVKEAEKHERNASKISLHTLLKEAATKKLRLRFWAHSLGEYLYILTKCGLTFRHRTYTINQSDWWWFIRMRGKQSVKKGVWHIGEKRRYKKRRYRKRRGKEFPIQLLASAAAPVLREVEKPILKKIFGGRKRRTWDKK